MPPFGFTDDKLNSFTALASPLPAAARGDFLRLVADRLAGYPEQVRGAGLDRRLVLWSNGLGYGVFALCGRDSRVRAEAEKQWHPSPEQRTTSLERYGPGLHHVTDNRG